MITFVKRIWKAAPIATVVLALALVVGLFFTFRMTAQWIYWNDAMHQDQDIAGWMTPGYVAHSWRVPREVVTEAIGATFPPPNGPRNLAHLASDQGRPVTELIAEAAAAIAAYRATTPVPEAASGAAGQRP